MSRKKRIGFCLDMNKHHYFFPFGKIDEKDTGEQYLIPKNPDGDHFSFHKSGEIHFVDMRNEKTIPIERSDITDPIIQSLDQLKELSNVIKEGRNDPDLKEALLFIIRFFKCIGFGCKNEKCQNNDGISFNIDLFIELLIDYSNEKGESILDGNEDEEEITQEETTFYQIFDEYLPDSSDFQCQFCKSRPLIHKSHGKFKMRKCDYCNGYGINLQKIEEYRVS